MKINTTWLAQHIDLQDLSLQDLEHHLTQLGHEVEASHSTGVPTENLVVAKILQADQHPDADRLKVTLVDAGEGAPRQIVCGAKNYQIGDHVPCALPGAILGEDFKIKESKLRGVDSRGMLCAASEIGLQDQEDGLLILTDKPEPGTPLHQLYPTQTILTLEITPNRPDCLSHHGIARELAAKLQLPLKNQLPKTTPAELTPAENPSTSVSAADACPLYSLTPIHGLKNHPSPAHIQEHLTSIGSNPKNMGVDITNHQLHSHGQPQHAFDASKINGNISVRYAQKEETFTDLNDQTHQLQETDLVIADDHQIIALAGIIGAKNSGCDENTTDILLESAYFDPTHIRRTSRRLGLITDSSLRFERGADPEATLAVAQHTAQQIKAHCGGEIKAPHIIGQAPQKPQPIHLPHSQTEQLLGTTLPPETAEQYLQSLGIQTTQPEHYQIPSHRRHDLQRPVDLIEEISRLHGIENIPSRTAATAAEPSKSDHQAQQTDQLRDQLVALGLHECRSLKLTGTQSETQQLGNSAAKALKNPISSELTHLRSQLTPGLCEILRRNQDQGNHRHAYFELGTVFVSGDIKHPLQAQRQHLAILLSGPQQPSHWSQPEPDQLQFHHLIGYIQALLPQNQQLKLKESSINGTVRSVQLQIGKKKIGWAGILKPSIARQLDASQPVHLAELLLPPLLELHQQDRQYQAPPKYPATTRDIALEAPQDLPAQQIQAFFNSLNQPLITDIDLFDLFQDPSGEKLPQDRKSLGWRLTYRSPDRTLSTDEIETIHNKIRETIQQKLPVKLR